MPSCKRYSTESAASDVSLKFDALAALTALGESIPLAEELQAYDHAGSDRISSSSRSSDSRPGANNLQPPSHTTAGQMWGLDANAPAFRRPSPNPAQFSEQALHMHAAAWAYGAVPSQAFGFYPRANLNADASIFVPRF